MTDPAPLSSRSVEELRFDVLNMNEAVYAPALDELCDRIKRRDAEIAELHDYIKSKHNAYGETGKALGMKVPATPMDALRELIEENEQLHDAEIAELRKRVDHAEPSLAFVVAAATKRNDATVHEALEAIAELRKAAGVNGDRASYLFNHSQGYAT